MLYIAVAATWFLLAFTALAICRLAAISDEAHALELADLLARGGWRSRGRTSSNAGVERLFEEQGEARHATG